MLCRNTDETLSDPPASASATPAATTAQTIGPSGEPRPTSTRTSPKAAIDTAHAVMAQMITCPCLRMRVSPPENTPARMPPAAKAAASRPVVVSPPPR